jgi:riboflavin synthase alpha subunit
VFTGIVEAIGRVVGLAPEGAGRRLTLRAPNAMARSMRLGDSLAINGVCLTVVERTQHVLGFDLSDETVRVTTLGQLTAGDPVNLERPMRLGARLGGHLVLGHVDGIGRVSQVWGEGAGRRLVVEAPRDLRPLMIPKGSVAVDGVSLTIAELTRGDFSVAVIPHTLAVTTLGACREGSSVNLEADVVGKYLRALVTQDPGVR